MIDKPAILIAGPTASGKSALAMALAERLGGAVINADSMQVYRELSILTARPTAEDEARVPHLLYGHVPAAEAYSAGQYAVDAGRAIAEVRAAGRVPVVVGGTGLYFRTLLEGLSPIPPVPAEVRARWRAEAGRVEAIELYRHLAARDPEMASRLRPTDPQRIVRALEVLDATGRSLAEWQKMPGEATLDEARTVRLVVAPERDELRRRCDQRFDAMMDSGALDEVRRLAGLGLDPEPPAMRALGVRPLMQLQSGALGREDAVSAAKAETRQYVKRQLTWLRGNMSVWKWLHTQQMERLTAGDMTFIDH